MPENNRSTRFTQLGRPSYRPRPEKSPTRPPACLDASHLHCASHRPGSRGKEKRSDDHLGPVVRGPWSLGPGWMPSMPSITSTSSPPSLSLRALLVRRRSSDGCPPDTPAMLARQTLQRSGNAALWQVRQV
ncbi:hypothetical protein LY76DRAFT_590784 [Colletotrichum caudatum]|nr:hypothetical protein LY76DRAFT_590784 [Colletotrichum caudatum]